MRASSSPPPPTKCGAWFFFVPVGCFLGTVGKAISLPWAGPEQLLEHEHAWTESEANPPPSAGSYCLSTNVDRV